MKDRATCFSLTALREYKKKKAARGEKEKKKRLLLYPSLRDDFEEKLRGASEPRVRE